MLIRDFNEYGAIFNGSGVAVEENEVDQLNLNIRFFFFGDTRVHRPLAQN